MLALSASGASGSGRGRTVFATGIDSPVRLASWTAKEPASQETRLSAGTWSPASISIRSPGTSSSEGTTRRVPSRTTFAAGEESRLRAARAFSARYSWTNPMTAFSATIATIATASIHSLRKPETRAAPMRTQMMKSANWPQRRLSAGIPSLPRRRFGPCSARRRSASSAARPARGSVFRASAASSTGRRYGGVMTCQSVSGGAARPGGRRRKKRLYGRAATARAFSAPAPPAPGGRRPCRRSASSPRRSPWRPRRRAAPPRASRAGRTAWG